MNEAGLETALIVDMAGDDAADKDVVALGVSPARIDDTAAGELGGVRRDSPSIGAEGEAMTAAAPGAAAGGRGMFGRTAGAT